jgi:hypothetical protein
MHGPGIHAQAFHAPVPISPRDRHRLTKVTMLGINAWRWLRVYYFEPRKDSLILDGVWPAVTGVLARDRESRIYFQRDWMGGPNVLLGMASETPDEHLAAVAAAIRTYLADHPSSTQLSAAEVSRRMASLAVQEHRLHGPSIPPQPNNSVRIESGEPYSPFLVDEALKVLVRNFLSRSSVFSVDWLTAIRGGGESREELCMRLMIVLAWLADPVRLRAHLSFSSHAQAFLRVQDRDDRLARVFADRYDGPAGRRVRELLITVTASLRSGDGLAAPTQAFVELLRETMGDAYRGLRQGRYHPVPAATLVGPAERGPVNYRRLIELLDSDPALRAWQITISLLYQVLNQLGMQAADRFFACYLVSRAVEDVFGEPATSIKRRMDTSGDHREMFSFFADLDDAEAASP